jgi:two-component system OmpR family response regulator
MAKILLVEDDSEMFGTIISWLRGERYDVTHTIDGQDGLEHLSTGNFDLAVIDWQLPGLTGVEISRQYRARRGTTPIIMLTGKDAITDRIAGLDSGADDYLTKPFSLKELSARIRALLRRPSNVTSDVLQVGILSLDPARYRVLKRGVEVQLIPRDFALLEFFMRHPDVVYSTETLLQRVWDVDSEASPEALRTSIRRLRRELDDGTDEGTSIIENIPRVGYRLRVPAN